MVKPPVPCQGDIKKCSAKAGDHSRTPCPITSKELTYQDHARCYLWTVRPGEKKGSTPIQRWSISPPTLLSVRAAHVENNSIGGQLVVTLDVRANVRSVPEQHILVFRPCSETNSIQYTLMLALGLQLSLWLKLEHNWSALG